MFYGQTSGLVEPIVGLLGCVFAIHVQSILPILLSFTAGSMIAACVFELIPKSSKCFYFMVYFRIYHNDDFEVTFRIYFIILYF